MLWVIIFENQEFIFPVVTARICLRSLFMLTVNMNGPHAVEWLRSYRQLFCPFRDFNWAKCFDSIIYKGSEFAWNGCLKSLKKFVHVDLNLRGKWSSPGGEVKLFKESEFSIKWYNKNKKACGCSR